MCAQAVMKFALKSEAGQRAVADRQEGRGFTLKA